ncbi:hypothetical protein HK405_008360 [Cladochytrium tenue]|nr:hypothetical protein HK405_008360 [Cladochytrium tenue]
MLAAVGQSPEPPRQRPRPAPRASLPGEPPSPRRPRNVTDSAGSALDAVRRKKTFLEEMHRLRSRSVFFNHSDVLRLIIMNERHAHVERDLHSVLLRATCQEELHEAFNVLASKAAEATLAVHRNTLLCQIHNVRSRIGKLIEVAATGPSSASTACNATYPSSRAAKFASLEHQLLQDLSVSEERFAHWSQKQHAEEDAHPKLNLSHTQSRSDLNIPVEVAELQSNKEKFLAACVDAIPTVSIDDVIAHEAWYSRFQDLTEAKKAAVQRWKEHKAATAKALETEMEKKNLTDAETRNSQKAEDDQRRIAERAELERWKQERQRQLKAEEEEQNMREAENARLRRAREHQKQELAKQRVEEHAREKERNTQLVRKLAEEAEKIKRRAELATAAEELERFQKRDDEFMERKRRAARDRAQRDCERELRLAGLRATVQVEAKRDPARARKTTLGFERKLAGSDDEDGKAASATSAFAVAHIPRSVTPSGKFVFSVPLFIAIVLVIFGTTALRFPFVALAGIFFRNTNGTETFVCASPANSAFELQDKYRNFSLWAWPVTGLDANGTIQPLSFGFNIGITLGMNPAFTTTRGLWSSLSNADGPNTYVLSYFYGFWSGVTPSQYSPTVVSTPPSAIFMTSLSAQSLDAYLQTITLTPNGVAILVDGNSGKMVGSSVPNISENYPAVYTAINNPNPLVSAGASALAALSSPVAASNASAIAYITDRTTKHFRFAYGGDTVYCSTAWIVDDTANLSLLLMLMVPSGDFLGSVNTTMRNAIIFVVVFCVFALGVGVVISWLLTAPLRTLTESIKKATNFDFSSLQDGMLDSRSFVTEIRSLQSAFRAMMKKFAEAIQRNKSLLGGSSLSQSGMSSPRSKNDASGNA